MAHNKNIKMIKTQKIKNYGNKIQFRTTRFVVLVAIPWCNASAASVFLYIHKIEYCFLTSKVCPIENNTKL